MKEGTYKTSKLIYVLFVFLSNHLYNRNSLTYVEQPTELTTYSATASKLHINEK